MIVLDVEAPGANRWNLALRVDAAAVLRREALLMLGGLAPWQGIDVGID